jgi:cell division protein ZapE
MALRRNPHNSDQVILMPTLADRYKARVANGSIERDPAQVALVAQLQGLSDALAERQLAHKSSALGWMFGKKRDAAPPVKGLYIWGYVGRGKTMLMDLFFEQVPVPKKRRAHFHAFMADVHARIHAERQLQKAGETKEGDPILPVAQALANEASLLCFDEFVVTDIADAMILGRLFTQLFVLGVTLVATSNVAPERLYENGLNRALFLPFIALLTQRVDIARLDARTDFRLEKLGGAAVYHVPADGMAKSALDAAFLSLSGSMTGKTLVLDVLGHGFSLPQVAGGVARASFDDLCSKPLGAGDYLALAQRFHTLVLDDIPVMAFERRNEAKRFIILIDTLYEHHVKLIASAQAEPQALYVAQDGYEAFAFDRTVSRLIEMRSHSYLGMPHGRGEAGKGDKRQSSADSAPVET